jgi:P4 family phage/plasmid primase-like protien
MATQPDEMLTAALALAQLGIRVFPLAPNLKVPLIPKSKGGRGVLDATTDEAQIRAWWKMSPRANIGVAMGFGLVGIDADLYKNPDAIPQGWLLPVTRAVRTARGGMHYWFSYEGELSSVPERDGLCIKATGGYLVAPPSIVDGRRYEWVDEHQPIALLPERIAKSIRNRLRDESEESAPPPPTQLPTRARNTEQQRRDANAHWLDWALSKIGKGFGGDDMGYQLAQQLLIAERNGESVDARGTLAQYCVRATQDPSDPFDQRSIERWLRSAQQSEKVAKGEPAKSTKVTPLRRERSAREKSEEQAPAAAGANALKSDASDLNALLLRGEPDDNGNAEAMWRLYGREILYTPALGWLRWTGTHWASTPEEVITQYAIKALKRRRVAAVEADRENIVKCTKQDKSRVAACRELFRSYVIEPDVSVFDADPDALNCLNGVLNLQSAVLTPHSSSQRFTYCLGIEWDETADESFWSTWLLDALGDDCEAADYFQLCAGYSLTGHTREEKMFYLYGPSRAGKGTVTETFLQLLPHPLSTEVDFATFTMKRDNDSQNFDLADLKPARLVVASESNRSQALNTARIKQLTGGGITRCAFKHRDMFSYRPQYKVWLVSNWEAKADADDDAAWGRVQVFNFPHSHLGAEDVTLKARMKSPENLRGVLRWAVEGAQRWYQSDRLSPPEVVVAATQAQRDSQDYVKLWIDDCCILGADKWAQSGQLMRSYTAWCEANNVTARSAADLADTLTRRFGCIAKRQAHTGQRGFKGIGFQALEGHE